MWLAAAFSVILVGIVVLAVVVIGRLVPGRAGGLQVVLSRAGDQSAVVRRDDLLRALWDLVAHG